MEKFASFNEKTVLRESKESTLNKCINLTQEQKAEALSFFNGKGQSLWSSVDWNRPKEVTWETIKALMDKSQQSNSQMKKRMKNLSVGLDDIVEGQDYEVTYSCDDYTLYHLLSHKGACVIASNKVYPPTHNYVPNWVADNNEWKETQDEKGKSDGAHWCISMFRTSTHWDDYTENGEHDFYAFCYNSEKLGIAGDEAHKKVCIDVSKEEDEEEETINFWNGDDDSFDLSYVTSWYRELLEDAVDRIDSRVGISDRVVDAWKDFLDFFGGLDKRKSSTGIVRTSTYISDNYEMYLEFYNKDGKKYDDFASLLRGTASRFSKWYVRLKVDVKGWRILMDRLEESVSDLGLDFNFHNGALSDLVASHQLNSTTDYATLLNAFKIIIQRINDFAEGEGFNANDIWEKVKSLPQFEGWEEMMEEGSLVLDKFNSDYYIYVGIVNNTDKDYNDKKQFLDAVSREKEISVFIRGGVINRNDSDARDNFYVYARGGNLYNNGTMAGTTYYYRGDVDSDIIRPLLYDFTILSNATGI